MTLKRLLTLFVLQITTVRPAATFSFGSREQSPSSAAVTHSNEGSPAALFNFSPEAPEALFQSQSMWNGSSQNQTWQNTMSMGAVEVSPSPTAHSSLMQFPSHPSSHRPQKSTLHIDPISDKSRVETQINVRLTLVSTPLNVTKLHLPRHTISKPKLLAKEEEVIKAPDTLELHTMLVCTSAMEKPELLDRALKRAAGIESVVPKKEPRRASTGDADDDADDPEKPCNGGEVRICENCMQRERKRASRKRVKKGEDETEWYKYEQQRVIVFNTNEYKEWQQPTPSKDTPNEAIQWPARTMQISAPMRIACYCRHQNEKSGFRYVLSLFNLLVANIYLVLSLQSKTSWGIWSHNRSQHLFLLQTTTRRRILKIQRLESCRFQNSQPSPISSLQSQPLRRAICIALSFSAVTTPQMTFRLCNNTTNHHPCSLQMGYQM